MNKKIISIVGVLSFLLLNVGIVLAACPDTHPKYCSNVDICFPSWVDCNTVKYCKDNYYGCGTGNKLICYQSEPWCFDKCIDENTVAYCGGSIWGCWIEGCDGKSGSVPTCYQGTYHCCPKDYPVYRGDYNQCWKEGWQCTSNDQCGTDYICMDYKCTIKKVCPTCPPPTAWSNCVNGKMQRSWYKCDAATNYVCVPQIETSKCGSECENNCEVRTLHGPTGVNLELIYNCPTATPEVAFKSISDKISTVWYYDEANDKWYVWSPGDAPDNLDIVKCGEVYTVKIYSSEPVTTAKFKCHDCVDGCLQVLTLGYNPTTGECKQFPTSCLDPGFTAVDKCPGINGGNGGFQIDWTLILVVLIIFIIILIIYFGVIRK